MKRDGFLKDVISGRDVNDRDRWLLRGQVLFQPNDDLSVRLIGDYAKRNEECCAARLPAGARLHVAGVGEHAVDHRRASSAALGGDHQRRSVRPRRSRSRRAAAIARTSRTGGVSGEIVYDFGWRRADLDHRLPLQQIYRAARTPTSTISTSSSATTTAARSTSFKTFTQELRLQGEAFGDQLDWLVGGYYANEKLRGRDNLGLRRRLPIVYLPAALIARRQSGAGRASRATTCSTRSRRASSLDQLTDQPGASRPCSPVAAHRPVINAIAGQVVEHAARRTQGTRRRLQPEQQQLRAVHPQHLQDHRPALADLGARYTHRRARSSSADLNGRALCATIVANIVRLQALAAAAAADPAAMAASTRRSSACQRARQQVLTPIGAAPACSIRSTATSAAAAKREQVLGHGGAELQADRPAADLRQLFARL